MSHHWEIGMYLDLDPNFRWRQTSSPPAGEVVQVVIWWLSVGPADVVDGKQLGESPCTSLMIRGRMGDTKS